MSHLSEAACLLKAGTLYRSRVLLEPSAGEPIFAGFKNGVFSIYFGDEPIFHFDLEGRWQRVYVEGTHYLKSLDTTIQAIERVREGENMVLKRRTLEQGEARGLDALIRDAASDLAIAIKGETLRRIEPPPGVVAPSNEDLVATLGSILNWDANAWSSQREQYFATYGPRGFIPPDALGRLPLQCTVGTRDGAAFGAAFSAPSIVRNAEEFKAHALACSRLLGKRTEQFKGLFLGGSDLVLEASDRLDDYLRISSEIFSGLLGSARGSLNRHEAGRGVQVFLDRFGQELPAVERWQEWKRLGLTEVTLGIESGDPEIRRHVGKSLDNEELIRLATMIDEAGLRVGLVVLLGEGGNSRRESHIEQTVSLVSKLPMRAGAIVSLVEQCASETSRSESTNFDSDQSVIRTEGEAIKVGLQGWRSERGTKVVFHNLEKQEASS